MNSPHKRRELQRVVVTGMGALSPNGIGVDAYGASLRNGVSGIGPITSFDAEGLECRVAAGGQKLPDG